MAARGTYVRICGGNTGPKSQGDVCLAAHPSRWAPLRPQRLTDHREEATPKEPNKSGRDLQKAL